MVCLFVGGMVPGSGLPMNVMHYVYAQNQDVKYEYDSLGRISTVRYPDGTEIKYTYDANGNLLYISKLEGNTSESGGSQTGGNTSESGGSQTGGNTSEGGGSQTGGTTSESGGNTQQNGSSTENANGESGQTQKPSEVSNPLHYTATDIKNYNQFKKKSPVIKSLKKSKSKKKYYLTIKIKQVKKRGLYGETGYQIKYATNKQFKKAKTIKLTRNKKSSITSKKWKVKKGKTYYVKVRAMMKTKTGKTIYSKYSKTKSIKVK